MNEEIKTTTAECPHCGNPQMVQPEKGQTPVEAAMLACDCEEGESAREKQAIRGKVSHLITDKGARDALLACVDAVADGNVISAVVRVDTENTIRIARTTQNKMKVKKVFKDEEAIEA